MPTSCISAADLMTTAENISAYAGIVGECAAMATNHLSHSEWCEHLWMRNSLSITHRACLYKSHCVAEERHLGIEYGGRFTNKEKKSDSSRITEDSNA